MKVSIETNKLAGCPLSLAEMEKTAALVLKKSQILLKNKRVALSVAFVASGTIRKINRQYRRKDKATDVLSFGEYPDSKSLLREKKPALFLGELIICCSVIKKSAKMNKLSFRDEFRYIFSHGILHLLGFDHGNKMFAIQDGVMRGMK